jgi:hypothetical protein
LAVSKTLEKIRKRPWVMHVDDERGDGSSIIVILANGFDFRNESECGVRGFDTVADAEAETRRNRINFLRK